MRLMYLLFLVLIHGCNVGSAQSSQYRVSGAITDEQGEPVPFGNVAVHSQGDSSVVAGVASDANGLFDIDLKSGSYFLKISFLSFSETVVQVSVSSQNVELGNIVLKASSKMLEEVVVEGEKNQMELQLDKRIFNVSKDLSNIGSNAAEILNNVPSVSVDVEGNVSLRGSQNVRILVNGKPSGMVGISSTDALRQMQGDMIESIEVITNPSSRYDAEGEVGIINIILKKNSNNGLNGSFSLIAGYPSNNSGSFNFNYRKNKVNLFSNFGLSYRSSPGKGSSQVTYADNDTSFVYDQTTTRTRSGLSNNMMLGVDYFMTETSSVTGSFLYRIAKGVNDSRIVYENFDPENGMLMSTTIRTEREEEPEKNMEGSLGYTKNFKKKGHTLTIDAKWIASEELENSEYEQSEADLPLLKQRSSNTEEERNGLFQLDYIHPFDDQRKLEGGLKSTLRILNNEYSLEQQNAQLEWEVLPAYDNNFVYTEKIHAAYAMGNYQIKKFFIQAGLRGELSDITTELKKTNEINNRVYVKLFPSTHFSFKFSEEKAVQLSYSYRLSRPQFRDLIPFSNFTDSRVFFSGNPNLNPEYTHALEAGYLLNWENGTLLSSGYYRHRTGVIQRIVTEVDSAGMTHVTPINMATEDAFGFEFNFSNTFKEWWKINASANFYRAITEGSYGEEELYSDTYTWTGRVTSRMTFFKKIDFQTSFNYRAPRVTTQGKDLSVYSIDLALSGDLLKKKGTLTASVRDLLNSQKRRTIVDSNGYYSETEFQGRVRQFTLTFTYRLNQRKENKTRDKGEEGFDGGDD